MGKDPNLKSPATLYELQQPEKLERVLAKDRVEDCMLCRVTGAGAFIGLGAYSYWSGQRQLELQKQKILTSGSRFGLQSRQAGITGIAISLVGMGFWRMVN